MADSTYMIHDITFELKKRLQICDVLFGFIRKVMLKTDDLPSRRKTKFDAHEFSILLRFIEELQKQRESNEELQKQRESIKCLSCVHNEEDNIHIYKVEYAKDENLYN